MSSFEEHAREFAGLPVRQYNPRRGIVHPESTCQRVGRTFEYGDPQGDLTFDELLDGFLARPACARSVGLVIGPWWDDAYEEQPSSLGVVERLVAARDRLPNLRAIFLGDIVREEAEVTWISQSDVTPLLEAFPDLEHLKVRGAGAVSGGRVASDSQRLSLSPVRHDRLRSLVFEAGCLPSDVSRAVAGSQFPALEHLELWLGSGFSSGCHNSGDTTVDDLGPILSGEAFPSLKSLGLRNSEIADAIAVALADAPVLRRLDVLDLSLGTLGDEGALALLKSGALSGLKRLDIHHHYVSDEVLDGLKATGVDLDAAGRKDHDEDEDDEDDDRYIALGE